MERILTDDGLFAAGNPATGTPGTIVTSVWLNNVQEEIANVIEDAEIELDGASRQQMLDAIKLIAVKTVGLSVVPTTPTVVGPPLIFVLDRWHWATWVETAYYTGYRSLNCGDWYIGSMSGNPRPHEIDGIGGIFDIADHESLWAWAQEEGYVVDAGDWEPKWTQYALIGTDQFRVPDYRDLFPRVEGTDVDTANVRLPGSYKADTLKAHTHKFGVFQSGPSGSGTAYIGGGSSYGTTSSTGASETRPENGAVGARILA